MTAQHRRRCTRSAPRTRSRGFTMIEAIVSAGLLLVVMSFSLQMTFRVDAVWQDTGHHRVAMQELSNQLGRLSRLSAGRLTEELESLAVSERVASSLHEAELTGEIIEDAWGRRLVLRLNWSRRHPGQPLEMSAWLPQDDEVASEAVTDEPETQP